MYIAGMLWLVCENVVEQEREAMSENVRSMLDALTERPARVGIVGLIAGIGIGLLIPHIIPYWRVLAFLGCMTVYVWFERARTKKKRLMER